MVHAFRHVCLGICLLAPTDTGPNTGPPEDFRRLRGHSEALKTLAFSSDGRLLASGSDDLTAKLWDPDSGVQLHSLTAEVDAGTSGPTGVKSVAFSSDDERLVTVARSAKVWDPWTGNELTTVGTGKTVPALALFSPDGSLIAEAGWGARLWDARTGRLRATLLAGFPHSVRSAAFSPDGKTLATGGCAQGPSGHSAELILWDVSSGKRSRTLSGLQVWVLSVAFSPDGGMIAASSWLHGAAVSTINVWNAKTGKTLVTMNRKGTTAKFVAFSPDSKTLAIRYRDHRFHLWSTSDWTERATISPIICRGRKWRAFLHGNMAFSPDSRLVATTYLVQERKQKERYALTEIVAFWDAATGRLLARRDFPGDEKTLIYSRPLAFSPDGKRVAVGSMDGSIYIVPVPEMKQAEPTETGGFNAVE